MLNSVPDLIVVSPYLRARQTAEPLLARFPTVPCETWPIQEVSYLNSLRGMVTTPVERRPHVEAYWARAVPNYRDTPDSESFCDMWARARRFLDDLASHGAQRVVAFGHGLFTRVVLWSIITGTPCPDGDTMRAFWAFQSVYAVRNCSVITLQLRSDEPPLICADGAHITDA